MIATLLASYLVLAAADAGDRSCVIVAVGASGTPEYGARFRRWAGAWQAAAEKAGAEAILIGNAPSDAQEPGPTDRDRLHSALTTQPTSGSEPLWIVLIGHGTSDGREAKFNLRGPDLSDAQLAGWLTPFERPLVVIDCTSASGPFLNRLSGPGRVVVTATRSGDEQNFARFGGDLAASLIDPDADLDKDGQVSLLEAFLMASSRVAESYRTDARLATEHALIDDNGDRLGTPADWFRGVRATRKAKDGTPADGLRAHQIHLLPSHRERALPPDARRRRDELERDLAALRDRKAEIPEEEYYRRLEPILIELARLYRDAAPAQ